MYYPYLRGKQYELLALRDFSSENQNNEKIVPIIEPVKQQMNGLMDFTTMLSLYYAYNNSNSTLADEIAKQKILQLVSRDLSKPLRRFDTELEYVPTQYVCEYCKLNGVGGIRFSSSLHNGGINVVLFDSSSAECVKVTSREISNVTIQR